MTVAVASMRPTSRAGLWTTQGQRLRRARSCRVEAVCERALEQASLSGPRRSTSRSFRRSSSPAIIECATGRPSSRVRPAPAALAPMTPHYDSQHHSLGSDEDSESLVHDASDALNSLLDPNQPLVVHCKTPPSWRPPPLPSFDMLVPAIQEAPSMPPDTCQPSTAWACNSPSLVSKVLNKLLPLIRHSDPVGEDPSSPGWASPSRQCVDVAKIPHSRKSISERDSRLRQRRGAFIPEAGQNDNRSESEVSALRRMLIRTFGNLTLAFRALKVAAESEKISSHKGILNMAEWEWLITRYLHYGDKHLARRLFAGIGGHRDAIEITLLQFCGSHPLGKAESQMSLLELRQKMIHRFSSLTKAFKELEDYMAEQERQEIASRGWRPSVSAHQADKSGVRRLHLGEFTDAAHFFGLNDKQAHHLFVLLDVNGDGDLTLDEFLQALTNMPTPVLLGDLRRRLIEKYHTVPAAIDILQGDTSGPLDKSSFGRSCARIGICEMEANTMFDIIDEDHSGEVSIHELRDALREVASELTLDEFWKRFAKQWPDVTEAAKGGREEQREAVRRLSEIVSPHLRRTKATPLLCLTAESFDGLCQLLDISRKNGADLFSQSTTAAQWRGRQPFAVEHEHGCPHGKGQIPECDFEDFFAVLRVWLDSHQDMRQHLGGVRNKLAALKELLVPSRKKTSKEPAENFVEEEEDEHLASRGSPEDVSNKVKQLKSSIRGRWR